MQTPTAAHRVVTLPGHGPRAYSVTASSTCDIRDFLREEHATALTARVFTRLAASLDGMGEDWPVTRLAGDGAEYIQVEAVSGVTVRPIHVGGRRVGSFYEDGGVTVCMLGNLQPRDLSASRAEQAQSVFEQLEEALDAAGMTVEHVVRTWFFIDHILDWYSEFNAVRTALFDKWGLFDGVLPASTGIGISNHAGSALVAEAIAVKPVDLIDVPSPLQCPAMKYKSSFSRAVEVHVHGQRRLYISGTASIAPAGRTEHVGDLDRQIELTMDVVREILRSRGMGWHDVTRGVAYFRDVYKAGAFMRYCRHHVLPELPLAIASADICRDDLLFEIEVDAAVRG